MKVLHVIPSVAPRDGGPSHAVVAMCAALRALDVDAQIATTDADGPDRLPVALGTQTAWRGVPAIFFRRNYTVSFKYSRGLASWLDAHVAEFDVVHAHAVLSHAPLAAAAACRATRVPYIVRPLGTVASWSLSRKAWRKQILMRAAGRRALAQAAAIHCTSREESDDLQGQGFPNTTVIPLGVDLPPDDAAKAPDSPPYVLSLSRLESKKNLETLIAAFADARRNSATPWRLVIAGDGDPAYAASLQEQVRQAGIERHVTFDGWVDGARKERLLAGAALFALPSHHENFGIAVLEAAARGVPAVVSRGVQLAETLEAADAAWVAGTDRASFAGALGSAMADDEGRVRRSVRARALARDYSWATVAERLRALYASVMHR